MSAISVSWIQPSRLRHPAPRHALREHHRRIYHSSSMPIRAGRYSSHAGILPLLASTDVLERPNHRIPITNPAPVPTPAIHHTHGYPSTTARIARGTGRQPRAPIAARRQQRLAPATIRTRDATRRQRPDIPYLLASRIGMAIPRRHVSIATADLLQRTHAAGTPMVRLEP